MLLEEVVPREVSVSPKGQQEAKRRVVGLDLLVSRCPSHQAELFAGPDQPGRIRRTPHEDHCRFGRQIGSVHLFHSSRSSLLQDNVRARTHSSCGVRRRGCWSPSYHRAPGNEKAARTGELQSLSCPALETSLTKMGVQQVQPNQWASKNYNFAQYNDRAFVQIGADGSISGGSMAGGQCIAFSVTTPPQVKKKKWYQ
jgi:hypothetical protein